MKSLFSLRVGREAVHKMLILVQNPKTGSNIKITFFIRKVLYSIQYLLHGNPIHISLHICFSFENIHATNRCIVFFVCLRIIILLRFLFFVNNSKHVFRNEMLLLTTIVHRVSITYFIYLFTFLLWSSSWFDIFYPIFHMEFSFFTSVRTTFPLHILR